MTMIKKVVVSAAGQGTRMLELSKEKSKHLICINDKPFLAYLMDNILLAGYTEILLVVGFHSELMGEFKNNYLNSVEKIGIDRNKIKIEIINQHEILGPKDVAYGTACPIKCAKDFIGNENFLSLAGDNFYSVEDLKLMNIDDKYNYVAGCQNEHPERFGVLVKDGDDFLEKIIEKPKEFIGNLINISFYKFTPEIFDVVNKIEKSVRGEYEITDAVSLSAREKKVKIKKINDFWMDFGRPEDIEKMKEILKKCK
ncbi:MAG: Glucose-1-phosphate thymidyltransferase [Parcubacteria group bacterium GW2011_GWC2_32_10]|nr:MAG: Glucose-1-phosphate thymidyltransferase [Parcubacteria group bacterium GW2011_GWC2_32_10]